MVKYSSKAAAALAFLKRPYNDVDIFVEDTSNPNMWLYLVRRLLPAETFITSVNAIGDWRAVVGACRLDQEDTSRRRLYIVDGDLRLILGKRSPRLKRLYQLSVYCVENLLLQEAAIVKCATIARPKETEIDISQKFAFDVFLEQEAKNLVPLFVCYALCHCANQSIRTVGQNLEGIYENTAHGPRTSKQKTLKRMLALRRDACDHVGLDRYKKFRNDAALRIDKLGFRRVVSGKHYLLPLLHRRFSALFGNKYSFEQWKVQLATYWDGTGDVGLARRIKNI